MDRQRKYLIKRAKQGFKQVCVMLPVKLHNRAKLEAERRKMTMEQYYSAALERSLNDEI